MKTPYIATSIFTFCLLSVCILACSPGTPPSAAFSANARSGTAPLTVSFYDNSLPGSSAITSWLWTFGDGGADSTQQNPQHTYTTPGSYTISLTVTSPNGVSTTTSPNYIEVSLVSGEGEGESVTITLPGGVALEVLDIPAGSFSMGQSDFEIPVHPVTVDYNFQMGKLEVTQAQWLAVMGSFPQAQPIEYPNLPVVNVNWHDCQNFITALNALGLGFFRLPSEAEWEYCCRAGTTTRWSHGNVETGLDNYAWYNSGVANAQVVGQKLPNPLGLYDMHGNVYEWVQDWYHSSYTGAPTDGSAWVSPVGSKRVLRGGFWGDTAVNVRSAYRWALSPADRFNEGGLRLVRLNVSGEGEGEGEGEIFGDAQHFIAGATPVAIGVADFTGDGKLDIVTAGAVLNEISLLNGDGAGAFQISDSFVVGTGLLDLVVTDMNEDGDADVVTGNSGSLSLLLGNGNGTFQAANNILTTGAFSQVIAADFTKDGNVDLAAVSSIPLIGGVFIRPGDGAGGLGAAIEIVGNPNTPISLASGDFNADGNLDIITANVTSNNVSVYLGDGAGALGDAISTASVANTRPNAVDVGDFDKDGKLDAVIANLQTGDISLLFGEGDGTLRAGGTPASLSGAAKLRVAEVDGDGKLDIITANPLSDDITLLYGYGDGTFNLHDSLPVGMDPIGIECADLNGDGKKDLASANRGTNDVSVILAK